MFPLTALWSQIVTVMSTTDASMLVIGTLIMLAAGLLTPHPIALGTSTLVGLLLFSIAYFAKMVGLGNSAAAVAQDHWDKFVAMPALMVLAYFIIFALPITIVHLVRKLVFLR
jgi:hypothetical protein